MAAKKEPKQSPGERLVAEIRAEMAESQIIPDKDRPVAGHDGVELGHAVDHRSSGVEQRRLLAVGDDLGLGHLGADLSDQPLTWGLFRLPSGHRDRLQSDSRTT